jgi:hypothetical protein
MPRPGRVTQTYYRQRINTDGSAEREFVAIVKNSGSIACYGPFLLDHMG